MTRYVQHKSGVGEKWKVTDCAYNTDSPLKHDWCVDNPSSCGIDRHHFLPKSEYVLVPPPEQWQDVTEECAQQTYGEKHGPLGEYVVYRGDRLAKLLCNGSYRLRKVKLYLCEPKSIQNCEQWAFIVEKRVQP